MTCPPTLNAPARQSLEQALTNSTVEMEVFGQIFILRRRCNTLDGECFALKVLRSYFKKIDGDDRQPSFRFKAISTP